MYYLFRAYGFGIFISAVLDVLLGFLSSETWFLIRECLWPFDRLDLLGGLYCVIETAHVWRYWIWNGAGGKECRSGVLQDSAWLPFGPI